MDSSKVIPVQVFRKRDAKLDKKIAEKYMESRSFIRNNPVVKLQTQIKPNTPDNTSKAKAPLSIHEANETEENLDEGPIF